MEIQKNQHMWASWWRRKKILSSEKLRIFHRHFRRLCHLRISNGSWVWKWIERVKTLIYAHVDELISHLTCVFSKFSNRYAYLLDVRALRFLKTTNKDFFNAKNFPDAWCHPEHNTRNFFFLILLKNQMMQEELSLCLAHILTINKCLLETEEVQLQRAIKLYVKFTWSSRVLCIFFAYCLV